MDSKLENEIVEKFVNGAFIKTLSLEYKISTYKLRKLLKKFNLSGHKNRGKYISNRTCNYRYFDQIDSEEKAYWLGFIYADGYVSCMKNGKPEYKLSVGVADIDKEHLNRFKESLNSTHKIVVVNSRENRQAFHRVDIYSRDMVESLNKQGVLPKKSKTCKFPEIDKEFVLHFIRGYFDGDGSMCSGLKISIIGSVDFIERLSEVLRDYNCESKIYKEKRVSSMSYLIIKQKSYKKLFLDLIYKNSTIRLDRKYKQYERISTTTIPAPN